MHQGLHYAWISMLYTYTLPTQYKAQDKYMYYWYIRITQVTYYNGLASVVMRRPLTSSQDLLGQSLQNCMYMSHLLRYETNIVNGIVPSQGR